MDKLQNRIGKICLAAAVALFLVMSMCLCAFAGGPDLSQKCSITFTMSHEGRPLTGGNLKMYRIATWVVRNNSYDFEWVPELADAGLNLEEKNSEVFARHVFMLVESRSLPAIEKQIDSDGIVKFSDLDTGLYVVYQTVPSTGYETINAFCVSLPISIGGEYVYDVQASPKPRVIKDPETEPTTTLTSPTKPSTPTTMPSTPDTPTTTPSTPPVSTTLPDDYEATIPYVPPKIGKLPQTGQLWWPTWTLGITGLILLGFGITIRVLSRQSAEESES